jgi:hypothetical protein
MGRARLSPNFSLSQLSYSETAEQQGIYDEKEGYVAGLWDEDGRRIG